MNSRSETSCRFSPSWRCQTIRGWGWPAGAGVPAHPVEEDTEIRIQLTATLLVPAQCHESLYAVCHIFLCLQNHTQVGKTKSILSNRAARGERGQVNVLNRSYTPSAIY